MQLCRMAVGLLIGGAIEFGNASERAQPAAAGRQREESFEAIQPDDLLKPTNSSGLDEAVNGVATWSRVSPRLWEKRRLRGNEIKGEISLSSRTGGPSQAAS